MKKLAAPSSGTKATSATVAQRNRLSDRRRRFLLSRRASETHGAMDVPVPFSPVARRSDRAYPDRSRGQTLLNVLWEVINIVASSGSSFGFTTNFASTASPSTRGSSCPRGGHPGLFGGTITERLDSLFRGNDDSWRTESYRICETDAGFGSTPKPKRRLNMALKHGLMAVDWKSA